jgi:subtilisin family serine protease
VSSSSFLSSSAQDSAAQLYLGFFGRMPDTAGFIYWASQIDAGMSVANIAQGFSQSAEFIAQYANLSHRDQVAHIYQNILQRAPDQGGWDYWSAQLDSGSPIGNVVWNLVQAAFNQVGTADGLLVQNQIHAAEARMAPIAINQASSTWSVSAGYGQADVSKALSAVLDAPISTTNTSTNTSTNLWNLSAMHFQSAWTAGYTGKGVVIAEIDTGIDLNNGALTQNLSAFNWNFVSNNANVQDDNGHGTIVASELVANKVGNATPAVLGGAYDAQLMVLKAADATGATADANLVAAINYAVNHGANVINISLGGNVPSGAQLDAINNAASHGVIVCMAAGNSAGASPQYPAAFASSFSTTIAVGATAQNDLGAYTLASFSNSAGTNVPYNFVDAPGSSILAYGLNGVLKTYSGSSIATPLISAEAADLLSAHSGLTANQIVQAIVHDTVSLVGLPPALAA